MNRINPRRAILAGLLGLGAVAGFGSGIASMAACAGHREHGRHHGAACDQRPAPRDDAPAPTPTPPEAAPPDAAPTPPGPVPTPVEPGQE